MYSVVTSAGCITLNNGTKRKKQYNVGHVATGVNLISLSPRSHTLHGCRGLANVKFGIHIILKHCANFLEINEVQVRVSFGLVNERFSNRWDEDGIFNRYSLEFTRQNKSSLNDYEPKETRLYLVKMQ